VDAGATDARDLVLKMYRENEERYDLSAFEKGRMFARWLEAGIYENQRDLAAGIALGEAAVAKYLAVAALPSSVLAAFGDERAIAMRWGPALSQALKANETAVLRAAERLAKRKPLAGPEVVLRTLVAAAVGKSAPAHGTSREESVRIGGRVPLKVGSGRNRIVLKLQHIDESTQKQLREELKDWAEAWLRRRLDGS
jgi:ParB family chromosome partitioning protein